MTFIAFDHVFKRIVDEQQNFVGKGLIHFNNSEVDLIKGSKSNDIETILGYRG